MSIFRRIFIYEHLTATAIRGEMTDSSLLHEGRVMAEAVLSDLTSLPGLAVKTLWGNAILPPDVCDLACEMIHSEAQRVQSFLQACRSADLVLIIAPESAGILQELLHTARRVKPNGVLNCSGSGLEIGCDKWRLAEFCSDHQIPHLPTRVCDGSPVTDLPAVVKPRDGAGTEKIQIVRNLSDIQRLIHDDRQIIQPLLDGIPLSSAACYATSGERQLTLPLGEQFLEFHDDTVEYRGGSLPWQHADWPLAMEQAEQIWKLLDSRLDGLRGYVGIDWLWQPSAQTLRLVEINPRLTTAYIGYRQAYGNQISRTLIETTPVSLEQKIPWIEFRTHPNHAVSLTREAT